MTLFGIPDPMIWLSYVGCIVAVAFCFIWAHIQDKKENETDDQ